jgi:Uma2 family endonuclease
VDRLVVHRRPPRPILFPSFEKVPEGKRHLELRTALYQILKLALADRATIGSDQFVYWNGREPKRCVAPDAFVRLGIPDHEFPSWKTWEHGAPQVAVEIASDNDREADWQKKLEAYHELGVCELVLFDADAPVGSRLRVWDRTDDELVERQVGSDTSPCVPLGLHWVVGPLDGRAVALRLARDPEGRDLLPTPVEAKQHEVTEKDREIERLRRELERRR